MDCIVTGGAGFIGSNLVDALVERGDRVTVVDNLSSGKRSNLEAALGGGASLAEVDVRDADAVAALFDSVRPDLVFHLAAQIDVRYSVEHPAGDATSNVLGTIAVLEAALSVRGSAGGVLVHRGRPLRRRRVVADAGGLSNPAARALRSRGNTPPRATASCTPVCMASRRSHCVMETSTARARTCTARPAWSRSSAAAWSKSERPPCSATDARRATGSTWPTLCARTCSPRTPR